MAPFRPSGRSNRSGRGQVDHDVFEGLPIRQWRQSETTIGPTAAQNQQPLSKDDWPEPPMPRDSHLLPDHSQALLRAARAGRLYKLPTPPDEEEKEKAEGEGEEETKETQTGYVAKKWSQVPRHLEEPEPEFLAKRRKGLPSAYAGAVSNGSAAHTGPMRETKVKKTDAEGHVHVYKVLVPEGQTVEGEVAEEDVEMKEAAPEEAAPGTVVEGVGVVNAEGVVVANDLMAPTPPRRRPPPPRRKPKKGPGRGRKKVMFTPGEGPNGTATNADGTPQTGDSNIKTEGTPTQGGDTPMGEAGEEEESGEEGEEGDSEDEDREEGEVSATPGASNTPVPKSESQPPAPVASTAPPAEPEPAPATAPVPTEEEPTPAAPAPTTEAEEPEHVAVPPLPPAAPEPIIPQKRRAEGEGDRDRSSSPEMPLASTAASHSRQNSTTRTPTPVLKKSATPEETTAIVPPSEAEPAPIETAAPEEITDADTTTTAEMAPAPVATTTTTAESAIPAPTASSPKTDDILEQMMDIVGEVEEEKHEEKQEPQEPQEQEEKQEQKQEQKLEQEPEPEEAGKLVPAEEAPASSGASEGGEIDIFGSLEQQLDNDEMQP